MSRHILPWDTGLVWDCGGWWNKLLVLYRWNKLLINKVDWCLVNYAVAVVVSLKSRVYVFGKSYYESAVVLYNDQNGHTF